MKFTEKPPARRIVRREDRRPKGAVERRRALKSSIKDKENAEERATLRQRQMIRRNAAGIEQRCKVGRCEARKLAVAAIEESRTRHRAAASKAFAEPFWPIGRALVWIAFGDPLLVTETVESLELAGLYDHPASKRQKIRELRDRFGGPVVAPELKIRNPKSALLLALQKGDLQAIKNGDLLDRWFWASVTVRDLPDGVFFMREQLLKLWKAPTAAGLGDGPLSPDTPSLAAASRRDAGEPGRPTSKELIKAELNRRIELLKDGEFLGDNITAVADGLTDWWNATERRPAERTVTSKTIRNNNSEQIRRYLRPK